MSAPQAAAITACTACAAVGGAAAGGAFSGGNAVNNEDHIHEEPSINKNPENNERNLEPEFKTLNDEGSQQYTDKTLGKKDTNKPLLVDYKHSSNQKWWEWAYTNKFEKLKTTQSSNLHPLFSAVNKNYDAVPASESVTAKKTSLNYACHYAYELKWYDFTSENHLLENVKLFCTKGTTPVEISEPEENTEITPIFLAGVDGICNSDEKYKNKFACKNTNKDKLVAPLGKDPNKNEDWWKWNYKKNLLPKKGQDNQINAHFNSVNSAFSEAAASGSPQTSLNQACDAAYKLTSIDGNLQENVKLFCSKGVTNTSQLTFS